VHSEQTNPFRDSVTGPTSAIFSRPSNDKTLKGVCRLAGVPSPDRRCAAPEFLTVPLSVNGSRPSRSLQTSTASTSLSLLESDIRPVHIWQDLQRVSWSSRRAPNLRRPRFEVDRQRPTDCPFHCLVRLGPSKADRKVTDGIHGHGL
jgi:hypothetical protein